jgi:hypothetical protein
MSKTRIRRPASDIRPARRSLVELTAAASRAVDDGLFVLSSGIAASNPRSEHTGDKRRLRVPLRCLNLGMRRRRARTNS